MLDRREWLRYSLLGAAATLTAGALPRALFAAKPADLTVYKTPTCGCCHNWVKHMEKAGFTVATQDLNDLSEIKANLGVPQALQSCHTAIYGRYVVEGHVPADLVRKMGKEKPDIIGLAVPGMPMGSPGMEGLVKQKYDVIAFSKGGKTSVYATR